MNGRGISCKIKCSGRNHEFVQHGGAGHPQQGLYAKQCCPSLSQSQHSQGHSERHQTVVPDKCLRPFSFIMSWDLLELERETQNYECDTFHTQTP